MSDPRGAGDVELPERAHSDARTVRAADGIALHVQRDGDPTAARTMLFLHGAGEHSARYNHVAEAVVARGWNVLRPDLRGHGRSGGVRTHVTDFEQYLDDLQRVVATFQLQAASTAIVGHSTGGLVAARYLEQHPRSCAAVVLLAPLFRLSVSVDAFTLFLGRSLAAVYPWARFTSRIHSDQLTRNHVAKDVRANDPLVQQDITCGWFVAVEQAMQRAMEQAPAVDIPCLVLQGEGDTVVDPAMSRQWYERIRSPDKSYITLPGQLHALLDEPEAGATIQQVCDWLEERVPQATPP